MTHMISTLTRNDLSRRRFLLTASAAAILTTTGPAAARVEAARELIESLVGEIGAIVGSDRSMVQKTREIERVIASYADVAIIARSTLGPRARTASSRQFRSYRDAFQGYLARKYTPRFEEFFDVSVTVTEAEPWKSHFQVRAEVAMNGRPEHSVIFRVSNRSGQLLVFDIIIEGISILKTEALEIRGLLDRSRGDLNKLTARLQSLHRTAPSG